MLNVDQITSELARLPDNSLQRYAMMHKDDPYVLSLAMSESNRRKQMRAGARMQAPQQPTVVEQQLAGMGPMPEEVGIGALPAPNMQRFDDGGIVGYADGGANPASGPAGQLAYNNEPVLRMAGGGVARYAEKGLVEDQAAYDPVTGLPIFDTRTTSSADDRTLMEKLGIFNPENRRALEQLDRDLAQKSVKKAPPVPANPADFGAVRPVGESPLVKPSTKASAKEAAVASAKPETPPALGLETLLGNIKRTLGEPEAAKSQEQFLRERAAYLGADPTIAQAERLAKLEEQAKGEKETAKGNALLRMGLGMMAARAVPGGKFANLMSAAGVGGEAGLKSLEESTKEFKAAEREREKMRSSLENAQYALKIGDLDAYDKYRKEHADRTEKRNEHLATAESHLSGIAMQGHTQREISAGTNATHLMAARIAAAGHDPLALYRALGNGNVTAGYTMAKQDPVRAQMTEKWSAQAYPATGMANEAFLKRYPTPETYIQEALTMQTGGGGAGGGGANEPVIRSR